MKTVFKLCLCYDLLPGFFHSIFVHNYMGRFQEEKTFSPEIGYLYAFSNLSSLFAWKEQFMKSEDLKIALSYLRGDEFKMCVIKGTTNRIVSQFHASIRHLAPNQLEDENKVKEFWNSNHSKLSRELLLVPESIGSILISDFTPVEVLGQVEKFSVHA